MAAALPFAPKDAEGGVTNLLNHYPQACRDYRFCSGLNPSVAGPSVDGQEGWVSEGYYGLDQGILTMMIENARSGLIWSLMRDCVHLREGLQRADFRGGWLADAGRKTP
jgi:hypothetical protein